MASYVHGCVRATDVWGAKNHFLIVFKGHSTRGNAYLRHCKDGEESVAGELTGPRAEPTTTILLNGQNTKLLLKFIYM